MKFQSSFRIYRINQDDNSVTILFTDFRGQTAYVRCPAQLKVLVTLLDDAVTDEERYNTDWLGEFGVTYQKGVGVKVHLLALL